TAISTPPGSRPSSAMRCSSGTWTRATGDGPAQRPSPGTCCAPAFPAPSSYCTTAATKTAARRTLRCACSCPSSSARAMPCAAIVVPTLTLDRTCATGNQRIMVDIGLAPCYNQYAHFHASSLDIADYLLAHASPPCIDD